MGLKEASWERIALEMPDRFPAPAWQQGNAPDGDIAISSRARFARNLADRPFPHRADDNERREVAELLLQGVRSNIGGSSNAYSMASLFPAEREYLVGLRLISPPFANSRPHSWLIVDSSRAISVLINEEDHLRLQSLLPGSQPTLAMKKASEIAFKVEESARFARHDRFGYLTASPFNVGNGLRVSVMMHLIGLSLNGRLSRSLQAATDLGITVRGRYGEGSRAVGGFFQVSCVGAFHELPERVSEKLAGTVRYLLQAEREARNEIDRFDLGNKVQESVSEARRSSSLTFEDSLRILSWIRLGSVEQLIQISPSKVDQWAALMEIGIGQYGAMDWRRSNFLRSALSAPIIGT